MDTLERKISLVNWKIDYFHLFTFLIIRRLFSNINDNIIIKCILNI